MPLDHEKILKLHDKAYTRGDVNRERAADDLVFYWVTQWDDNLLGESQLQYRGEFNVIRKAGRQIMSDLYTNPIQVDFDPVDGTDDSGADIIDGMYRSDMRNNRSQEAKKNALQEAVVCGVGAWELITEYKSNRSGNREQVIRRIPIYEANNNVFWDPNARLMDKSDAKYVSYLAPYSEDGYRELVEELTGEEKVDPVSFAYPEISYAFPWLGGTDEVYYVSRFYYKETVKINISIMVDMSGNTQEFEPEELKEKEDDLINDGWDFVASKEIYRDVVTLYIVSGEGILHKQVIAGEHIPIVPDYGERAFVEGQEHYEGITRLAKDPQRLRNFQLSYLADIVSRSPRQKPIYLPEQVQGFEDMYEESGSENNYPYQLQHRTGADGSELPLGPVGVSPEQPIPQALMASIQESRLAVEDVANPGLPQDIIDTDASGKAVNAMQHRLDMQSYVYQDNHKTAMRRDGEIYASMAKDIYDTPRKVLLTSVDGSTRKAQVNEQVFNPETFEMEVKNDMGQMIFDVYADIGPQFESVKAQNREELKELINGLPPGTPAHSMMLNEYLTLIDGVMFKDVREYARKQLILMGVKDPETPEEQQMLQQAQQQQGQQQPDPAMMLAAQAEMEKAKAQQMEQQNKQAQIQLDAVKVKQSGDKNNIDFINTQSMIEERRAQTLKTMAETDKLTTETVSQQMANVSALRGSATQ
jgi:hypothetical protein